MTVVAARRAGRWGHRVGAAPPVLRSNRALYLLSRDTTLNPSFRWLARPMRFFITAPTELAEDDLIHKIQACGISACRHFQTTYGSIACVDVDDVQAIALAHLADLPKISVIPATSRGGRAMQLLFDKLDRKSA